jgi:hypothetical protein
MACDVGMAALIDIVTLQSQLIDAIGRLNRYFAAIDPAGASSIPEVTDNATIFETVSTAYRQRAPD